MTHTPSTHTTPDLCEDEGCPHHGTPHVCINIAQQTTPAGHRIIGTTYDGVKVLAPKTKSRKFTAAAARRAIRRALKEKQA